MNNKHLDNILKTITKAYALVDEIEKKRHDMTAIYNKDYIEKIIDIEKKKAVTEYNKAWELVQNELSTINKLVEERKSLDIAEATNSEDVKLLSLPIEFTYEELKEMVERNKNNCYILRMIDEKAKHLDFNEKINLDSASAPDWNKMAKEVNEKINRLIPYASDWETVEHANSNQGLTFAFAEINLTDAYGDIEL